MPETAKEQATTDILSPVEAETKPEADKSLPLQRPKAIDPPKKGPRQMVRIRQDISHAKVRTLPGEKGRQIALVKGGRQVEKVTEKGNWIMIRFLDGNEKKEGWIYRYALEGTKKEENTKKNTETPKKNVRNSESERRRLSPL